MKFKNHEKTRNHNFHLCRYCFHSKSQIVQYPRHDLKNNKCKYMAEILMYGNTEISYLTKMEVEYINIMAVYIERCKPLTPY